jgi:hypothetical protein
MISFGIAALAAMFYFVGRPQFAFWLIVLSIISGLGAVLRSIADPVWYMQKRVEAGLDPGNGIGELVFHKAILIGILSIAAWWLGRAAGYF